jgi:hypothetical protein
MNSDISIGRVIDALVATSKSEIVTSPPLTSASAEAI